MMELKTCAFIITLISVVTATPYGYGVKGGAGATSGAESSAAAGSFGNRGDIATGAFSGSFSKSSSSSSSSSSASSSSSSSSFSYNGFGGGSFSSPGPNGNTGCTSGICPNAGHQGSIDIGAGLHGYSAANSAALAGSGSTSGVDCRGSQCDGNSDKCLSGECQPKIPIGSSNTGPDSGNKCSSGQCGSSSGPAASKYDDSDDIHFVAHTSKSAHDSKDHSFNDKITGYTESPDCRNGNCGPSKHNTQPGDFLGSSKPYTANLNSGVTPGYNLPATYLETPNLNSGCNSEICKTSHDSSPSSYNVPIHGSPAGCNTPGCSSESSVPGVNPQLHYDNTNTLEKKLPPYTGGFGGPGGLLKPNEYNIPVSTSKPVHFANPTHSTPSTSVTGCKTSNCIGSPTVGVTSATTQAGSYNTFQESGSVTAANNKPIYTGGFGGPAGMLKPDDFDIKVPIHSASPSYNNHSPTPSVVCNSPNCNGYATKPTTESSSKLPPYTGGFGGPSGILKPNEFNIHYSTPSTVGGITPQSSFGVPKPITVPQHSFPGTTSNYRPIGVTYSGAPAVAPITPSYTITQPHHPSGISSADCNTGNCATYPGSSTVAGSPSGSYGSPEGCKTGNCAGYPVTGADISSPSGAYGSPGGCKSRNCASYPVIGADVSVSSGSYGSPEGCKTGNCAGYPVSGADVTAPAGSYGNLEGCKTGNCAGYPVTGTDVHAPSGSYGSPEGCKTGNCAGYPVTGADVTTSSGAYGSLGGCKTGNCAFPTNVVSSGPHSIKYPNTAGNPVSPQYNGGYSGPSNSAVPSGSVPTKCTSSNCADSLLVNGGVNAQSGSYSGSKEQLPVYTGGFGGPPGLLKPNDYTKPDLTAAHNKPVPGLLNPAACSSGNCHPKEISPSSTGHNIGLNGVHTTATSSASADAVAYTGTFGGPPGILVPYDNGKVDLTKITDGQNQLSYYGGANVAGQTGTLSNIDSISNAAGKTTVSGSTANANSGSLGYNTQSNGIKEGSPCGGGCSGGYQSGLQGSGSSAAAGARSLSSSGAYGAGGSFASSSASAHSSAGAYTKGGYGKR